MRYACRLATLSAAGFAHPLSIIGLLLACGFYWHLHRQAIGDPGVYLLSVFALSTTQLVLLAQDRDAKALQKKMDEIIRALPEARNELIGIEAK